MRGVRNAQARNNLAAMRMGDQVLFYHSQHERAVVGLCEVEQLASPDPTSDDPRWLSVIFKPIRTLACPVPLLRIRKKSGLEQVGLVRQPRLSVMPLTESEFNLIVAISDGKGDM